MDFYLTAHVLSIDNCNDLHWLPDTALEDFSHNERHFIPVVIGNIVRTEWAVIFVHFSVRWLSAKFSDIAISKYINGFNVFSKATCDPMPFTQICCNIDVANVENCLCIITDTSLAPSPHKPSAETPTVETLSLLAVD